MVRRIKQDRWKLWVFRNVQSRQGDELADFLGQAGPRLQRMVRVRQEQVARKIQRPGVLRNWSASRLHVAYRNKRKGWKK